MDDLISRQAAIDAMCELMHHWFGGDSKDEVKEITRELWKLPSAQPEPRWIPVEERLPEEGKRVLVTYDLVNKYPWVNILHYGKSMYDDKPCFYEADSEWGDVPYDGIVAWMPLPKPYERSKDG